MILTIGVLVASAILLLQLRGVFYGQTKLAQEEVVGAFANDLENIVDKAVAVTGNATFVYYPAIKSYTLTVKNATVLIYDKISKITASFTKTSVNLQDMAFEDSEIIYITKVGDSVYILGKCRESGESCSYSIMCCHENPYCWGSSFVCHENCASLGEKAADDEACCSVWLNKTSGVCELPPICPPRNICPGASEPGVWKDINDKDCCPGDRPICSGGHCCPSDKPIWCERPKPGYTRGCMNITEYEVGCEKGDVLIVALKTNLKKVYSDAQIITLENKINDFINSLINDGLNGIFLYLDEDETSDIIGNKVTNPNSWNNIDGILDQLIPRLNTKYLIIIGGYDRFVQAPIGSSTGSDDPYGDYNPKDNLPEIPVGRIPDPNNGDLDVILNALDTAISLHNTGGLDLTTHVAPIMGCGGFDNKPWNSGKCFCKAIWGSSFCDASCNCNHQNEMSGKDFVMILAHGPGAASCDLLVGGCIQSGTSHCHGRTSFGPSDMSSIDVSEAVWMSMSCGGGHLMLKSSTSDSITMTFLKRGGAVYFGSTNNNNGDMGSCSVPGGDSCIGSLYTEIASRFTVGKRIGDAYREGKNYYLTHYSCPVGTSYQGHINCLYGDPTLKIRQMW